MNVGDGEELPQVYHQSSQKATAFKGAICLWGKPPFQPRTSLIDGWQVSSLSQVLQLTFVEAGAKI